MSTMMTAMSTGASNSQTPQQATTTTSPSNNNNNAINKSNSDQPQEMAGQVAAQATASKPKEQQQLSPLILIEAYDDQQRRGQQLDDGKGSQTRQASTKALARSTGASPSAAGPAGVGLANYFKRLHFGDRELERKYHVYYAQVKRDLLPTAIQVVFLVNLVQFLATCLNYYLLQISTNSPATHHAPSSSLSTTTQQQQQAISAANATTSASQTITTTTTTTTSDLNAYSKTLVWPISFQLIIFVITFAMQRSVRAELSSSSGGGSASGQSLDNKYKRHSRSSYNYASNSSSEDDDELEDGGRNNLKQRGARASSCSSSGSSTSGSGSCTSSTSSSSSSSSDESASLKHPNESSSKRRARHKHRRRRNGRHRHGPREPASLLSRWKLSLPYILWLCQLLQLASGLWPQQSFISYATLLLYSYAIYVILPIRLHSCILLAIGLSLIEPALDHLLLLELSATFNPQQTWTGNNRLQSQPQTTTTTTFLAFDQTRGPPQQAASSDLLNTQFNGISNNNNNNSARGQPWAPLMESALVIPMTSHFSKLWSFMLLTVGVNVIGVMSFFFYERQQRAAFLETQQSLDTKLILERESREQERLLLSILPKHLASEIRQDLGAVVTGQFKKIYMSRHENVSILFADIVGFTAISSHCPAPELVKTLNELFARFDKLAEKYHQLRIKILGDCYYAISGAPQERPDHAVLCVHMGLSMVEAIKSVRSRTKSTVDMRVGVHTGGVLAGVLGQRQWQFDVYSRDVELANKMESSGLPGRVHISHATLRFLNDEFEVSEGDGASREEALRLANIKTYFIDRVKKPYPEGTLDALKQQQPLKTTSGSVNFSAGAIASEPRDLGSGNVVITIGGQTVQQEQTSKHCDLPGGRPGDEHSVSLQTTHSKCKSEEATGGRRHKRRRHSRSKRNQAAASKHQQQQPKPIKGAKTTALTSSTTSEAAATTTQKGGTAAAATTTTTTNSGNGAQPPAASQPHGGQKQRNDSFGLDNQIKQFSLNFSNHQFERQFRSTSDITSCISLVGLPITLLCAFAAYLYLYKVEHEVRVAYVAGTLLLLAAVLICVLPYLWWRREPALGGGKQRLVNCLLKISETVGQSAWMKLVLSAMMTLIWLAAHSTASWRTVELFESGQLVDELQLGTTQQAPASSTSKLTLAIFSVDLLNYFSITCALAITAITRISFLVKTIIILIVILQQVILNKTILANMLATRSATVFEEQHSVPPTQQQQHLLRLLAEFDQYVFALTLVCICWALFLMNRQFELTNRRLFLWRKQVEERKEKVADMRRKNEALVYNILPPNVAKIFLGRRQLNDEELYSKSYDAVGVLFAAMPNFSDFYTEESVNNQGLECLRFLNEVISDYDALLDQDRFKNIIKIKTMGSTYMAASGLYEGDARAEALAINCDNDTTTGSSGAANGNEGQVTPQMIDGNEGVEGEHEIRSKWGHLEQLTEFALALKDTLNVINKESFNNFVLRIGINQGPITAGVIGVKKPHFDMWGNTVNVASRMESTGRAGSIQVVEETATILRHFGFQFDQRGLILVKGKGKLMTYYLTGRQVGTPQQHAGRGQQQSPASPQLPPPPPSSTSSVSQSRSNVSLGQTNGVTSASTTTRETASNAQQPQVSSQGRNSLHSLRSQDSMGPCGGASEADNRRHFITPARRDFDTDADIHLV